MTSLYIIKFRNLPWIVVQGIVYRVSKRRFFRNKLNNNIMKHLDRFKLFYKGGYLRRLIMKSDISTFRDNFHGNIFKWQQMSHLRFCMKTKSHLFISIPVIILFQFKLQFSLPPKYSFFQQYSFIMVSIEYIKEYSVVIGMRIFFLNRI